MKRLIKDAVLPFIYLFFMAMTAFGILTIGDHLLWLKIVLCVLNLALYGVIVCAYSFKLGEDAVKVRNANDLERRHIVETGEIRELNLAQEYKPHKGFLIGFMVCVPLVLLLIAHTIVFLCGGGNACGIIASIIYMVVYAFSRLGGAVAVATSFYWSLLAIPVIMLMVGFAYILGAKKIEAQQARIKEQQRRIYGE